MKSVNIFKYFLTFILAFFATANVYAFEAKKEIIDMIDEKENQRFWAISYEGYANKSAQIYLKDNKYVFNYLNKHLNDGTIAENNYAELFDNERGIKISKDNIHSSIVFVKAISKENVGNPYEWTPLYKIDPSNAGNIPKGTLIATFNKYGNFGKPGSEEFNTGNTAIFLMSLEKGIWVMGPDHNDSRINVYFLEFTGKNDFKDAGSFSVFK